jgi:hypothetical protein
MAEPSRGPQISRRGWLLAGLAAPLFPVWGANSPVVTFDGDNLHISSFGLHFLQGQSLVRLKEGRTVEYVAQVTLFRDQFITQFKRPTEFRFLVSYDIWGTGDQFSVSLTGPQPRKIVNQSLSEAETWCFERVVVPVSGIPKDRQFWLQLDLRAQPPRVESVLGPSSINVDLIEIFTPGQDERQTFKIPGPLRLIDLAPHTKGRQG